MTMRIALTLLLLTVAVPSEAACESAKPVTEAGKRKDDGRLVPRGLPGLKIEEPGSRYLRASVVLEDRGAGDWALHVRDQDFRLIETLMPADFAAATHRWTPRVDGSRMWLELDAPLPSSLKIRASYLIAMPVNAQGTYYSLQGSQPRYEDLYIAKHDEASRRMGDHVGFLMTSYGKTAWSCSGVLLTPSLFLTNWHCGAPPGTEEQFFWISETIQESLIDMSWDEDQISREMKVNRLVASDSDLDYALLDVAPLEGTAPHRGATLNTAPIAAGSIRIIHHPVAATKQISADCSIVRLEKASWLKSVAGTDFTHNCDTEAGSSGAPVFNERGEVIGLHHRGFDFRDDCTPIARENKAVRIEKILADIEKKSPGTLGRARITH